MASNESIALEAHFKTWRESRFPNPQPGFNVWEYYCIEQFARSFDLGDSQLKTGIVGQGQDGGIDAFFILANGELVDSETELDAKDPPQFKLLIMQVKSGEGFSPVAVDKMYWFTDDLLNLSRKKADYHTTYHSDMIDLMRVFKDKFGIVVGETPPLSIEYIYVIKKDVQPGDDCQKSVKQIKQRCKHYFQQVEVSFRFINATALLKQVQTRPPRKKTLRWASQPLLTQEGEIGLVRLIDYYEFIKEADGKIAERFFDSNVRGYWPTSGINRRIGETLKDANSPEFWLLNNGITILTEKTENTANYLEIEIHDPQIVNGLQTSRQIYNHFTALGLLQVTSPVINDPRRVLLRVIKSGDTIVRDSVIRCTNSQNEMPDESLRATDAIHRQLEISFRTQGLFYDRRKGYYRDQGKPVAQIVSIIEVLQSMLSVVLQRPDDARARPRDYIKKTDLYNTVFGVDIYPLTAYLKATELCRRVSDYLDGKQIEYRHRRNVNFYLCMYASCVITQSAYPVPVKLQAIDISKLSDALLEDCYARVWKMYDKTAEKFTPAGEDRDYDLAAKGPHLLKVIYTDLKRRFVVKKKK
jgi:hypothetical protein